MKNWLSILVGLMIWNRYIRNEIKVFIVIVLLVICVDVYNSILMNNVIIVVVIIGFEMEL